MTTTIERRTALTAVVLCWTAVLLDGYDLGGARHRHPGADPRHVFGITAGSATTIATAGLVGMTIGAMGIGTLTDYLGRRKVLIASVLLFSIFMIGAALSTSFGMLTTFRFLAGLGLGGCLPTAITLVTEFSRKERAAGASTLVLTGYHIGAILTALFGLAILGGGGGGWRWMLRSAASPA